LGLVICILALLGYNISMLLFSIFLWLFLGFTLLLVFIIASSFLGFLITRVPFVTSPEKEVLSAIKEAGITSQNIFYDLGSGNGKICFLAEKSTGAKAKGFELTLWNYLYAKLKARLTNSKAQFYRKDFFKENWAEANYIYAYLYPSLMRRVEEKFVADCRTGSIAIIRDFPFPNLKPFKVLSSGNGHEIYLYIHSRHAILRV